MPESPLVGVQILGHQLLGRWLLWHVLSTNTKHQTGEDSPNLSKRKKQTKQARGSKRKRVKKKQKPTSGGRHSSACRLNTENPPCVLVSDAVSVLQNECTWNLGGGAGGPSFSTAFSSCYHSDPTKKIKTHQNDAVAQLLRTQKLTRD